ncbi:MAG: hypothetical protein ACE5KD_00440 [Candidatus Bathyarchaeia archaeon]
MTRHKVVVEPMMEIRKSVKKDLGGGKLGLVQRRKLKNTVRSPRLLAIMACMASELAGKSGSLGAIQERFAAARKGPCAI